MRFASLAALTLTISAASAGAAAPVFDELHEALKQGRGHPELTKVVLHLANDKELTLAPYTEVAIEKSGGRMVSFALAHERGAERRYSFVDLEKAVLIDLKVDNGAARGRYVLHVYYP